jgi:hypothetical protein
MKKTLSKRSILKAENSEEDGENTPWDMAAEMENQKKQEKAKMKNEVI